MWTAKNEKVFPHLLRDIMIKPARNIPEVPKLSIRRRKNQYKPVIHGDDWQKSTCKVISIPGVWQDFLRFQLYIPRVIEDF
jgi:hypothetical protein